MHPSLRTLAPSVLMLAASGLVGRAAVAAPGAGNAERGRTLFQQSCALCHPTGLTGPQAITPAAAAAQNALPGPTLAGVVGRPSASVPNYGYTKALEAAHLTWDTATLDKFLSGPTILVPGTVMPVPVADPADRRDLIAFLATLRPALPPTPGLDVSSMPRKATAGDWANDAPGVRHRIEVGKLPAPFDTVSARINARTTDKPANASLSVPAGFQVKLFLAGLSGPRLLRTAPNGDIFIAETSQNRIRVLRAADGADAPAENAVFVDHLSAPFGIAFYPEVNPQWIYVANINSVVRFPYHAGDLKASGPAETIVPLLADSTAGHTTRDIGFSLDGKRMFISVGSGSNVAEGMPIKSPDEIRAWEAAHARGSSWGFEANRANVLVADPMGQGLKIFATGIRNPVGLAVQPATGEVWVSTNERDALGDDLVPDYVTHVKEGGYYGWPWYYMGNHEDPRHPHERPDLANEAIVPDVPEQAHSASLQLVFYPLNISGVSAFPAEYRGDIFVALHGSWNRSARTGTKVVRIHLQNGKSTGEYEDFMTGFVIDDARVWGRPVGVTVARDGALIVSDDANGTIWRISHNAR
ncbi:MAG TPA: PQQ-dependent sugar dehydrogenase [Opitutaceae bacterium]|nr:PQQ-dependent sugar dehydrogenase [Opitutaceae bacterium]